MTPRLGISGRLARLFQDHPLTPVLALAAVLLGLVALAITPREEEPQIDVTMANVTVAFPGASAADVESLVATPLEQRLAGIAGVKHVYSVSRPGAAVVTVEFDVGVPRPTALVRLHNQMAQNRSLWPPALGVAEPVVHALGIDDVPVLTLALWTDDASRGPADLAAVARALEVELKRVPGTRDVYVIGAPTTGAVVTLDSARLASHGLTHDVVARALAAANVVVQAGDRVAEDGAVPVTVGTHLATADDVGNLVLGLDDGRPVRVRDIADVRGGADVPDEYVWFGTPPGRGGPATGRAPAVTMAVTKLPGSNATDITRAVRTRLTALAGIVIPSGVHVVVTRDYGATANAKADLLIHKLVFATLSVVLLVLLVLGWREALVVGVAVVVTLLLTLFASWAMGFTLNRVSLFALVFSIGILVDDAIVVVENIHRHAALGQTSLREAIPAAVAEVGGPTILATFTVIAALLPMAFVSGLMGPYMRPIPINASAGMLLSLAVALVMTPWLARHLVRVHAAAPAAPTDTRLARGFVRVLRPFLDPARGARRRHILFTTMAALVLAAVGLVAVRAVILKMLPFDNKSEFQVVLDMPEGSTLEATNRVLGELAAVLDHVPEVENYQAYAGTAAPITFNGLVRQYALRTDAHDGDLQVNLVPKDARQRQSHAVARAVRPVLAAIGARHGAAVKVVEVPPGPPVRAPIVAEIHGATAATRRAIAEDLAKLFHTDPDLVDIDTSLTALAAREIIVVNRSRAAELGVTQADIAHTLGTALAGRDATYLVDGHARVPQPVRLRLPAADQAAPTRLLSLRVRGRGGALIPLSEFTTVRAATWDGARYHKDLAPYAFVTADDAGATDSPLYGLFAMASALRHDTLAGQHVAQHFTPGGDAVTGYSVTWDGEWTITRETFRDMGLAYLAGLVLIYLLVVGHFRRYVVPLIIMAPIPLTIIGVMPGHAVLGAQFTATSMIGMIALAGIIVRNSILLIDFVDLQLAAGRALTDAVIDAAAVRAKPILLTALAAMIGGFFILDDPIFQGLAVALIFGILVATVLTLMVIPLLYFAWLQSHPHAAPQLVSPAA